MSRGRWLGVAFCVGMLPVATLAHHTGTAGACVGGDAVLLVPPRNGDGYITVAQRYLADPGRWKKLRSANGRRNVQVGRPVRIPLDLLPPALRHHALTTLFPDDRYEAGEWIHRTGSKRGKACREDAASLAAWFAGRADLGSDLARLNGLKGGAIPAGRSVAIPREMLLPVFAPAEERSLAPTLTYGQDEQGAFAVYRLRAREALYTSVIIRFTGRLDADEVNQLAAEVAARSGIRDVRNIPIGFSIKIPREMLLARHLPRDDPGRIAWEQDRSAADVYRVQARARRLRGVHVILDAGHGGIDVGTTQNGMDEDEYVYDVMCRIKRRLEQHTDAMALTTIEDRKTKYVVRDVRQLPRDRNELIRTTPPYIQKESDPSPLGVNLRWYLANSFYRRLMERGIESEKIVFVSFHADSLHSSVQGAMIYVPGEKYRSGRYGNSQAIYGNFEEVRQQPYVSFDRSERLRSEGMSRQFANGLIQRFRADDIPVHAYEPVRNHVIRRRKSWVPAVIRCSAVPVSVLVELVNLNNAADRKRLQDPAFREKLAVAFVDALQSFYEDDGADQATRTTDADAAGGSR